MTYNRVDAVSLDINGLDKVGRLSESNGLGGGLGHALSTAIESECRSGSRKDGEECKRRGNLHGDGSEKAAVSIR